jgi:sugar lactone lactonase YvrE
VHPDGRLFVVDTGNFRIQSFSPEGEFLHSFGKAGRFPGSFSHPKGIAIDVDGKVFITDSAFGVVQIFDDLGRVLMDIGTRTSAPGPGNFMLPAGVATDIDGRIYAVDQYLRKVDVFREATVPDGWPLGRRKTVAMPPPPPS